MKGKMVNLVVISILLVVVEVVGVVAVVKNNEGIDKAQSASSKIVASICERTRFKEMCASSLESAAKNSSATAQDYLVSAVNATIEEVKKGLDATRKVWVKKTDIPNYTGVESCKKYLDSALDALKNTITVLMDSTTYNLKEHAPDLRTWVCGAYAMHSSCLDLLTNPKILSRVENGINNSTQLASNAAYIIIDLPKILSLFGDIDEGSPSPSPSSSTSFY